MKELQQPVLDEQAFRSLYRQYWKSVWGVCYSIIKDQEIAKGLTQDIFLYLWDKRETLRISGPVENYLVRAAKLRTYEYIRNKAVRDRYTEWQYNFLEREAAFTEQDVMRDDLAERVEKLLAQVTPRNRQIFRLREDGLSNREIAVLMNMSEKAVEYHITKVLAYLRKNLSEFLIQV